MDFIILTLLISGVVFVNGWTDAPGAIATAIATRSIKPRPAAAMAAVFNCLGVTVTTLSGGRITETITGLADFGKSGYLPISAAMTSIIIWAVTAWFFGIPTSESHALIGGLSGAAIAVGGVSAMNLSAFAKVLWGLAVSTAAGFAAGLLSCLAMRRTLKNRSPRTANPSLRKCQVLAAAACAFFHGAQDGQKFIGVMITVLALKGCTAPPIAAIALSCGILMGIGTSVGGFRIVKSVGVKMVKLTPADGLAADIGTAVCLLVSTAAGLPLSTTHTKSTVVMGVGRAGGRGRINLKTAAELISAWALTFPACAGISYFFTKLFI